MERLRLTGTVIVAVGVLLALGLGLGWLLEDANIPGSARFVAAYHDSILIQVGVSVAALMLGQWIAWTVIARLRARAKSDTQLHHLHPLLPPESPQSRWLDSWFVSRRALREAREAREGRRLSAGASETEPPPSPEQTPP